MTDERAKQLAALVRNPEELREYLNDHSRMDNLHAVIMLADAADLARRGLWRTAIDAARQAIVVMEAQT